MRSAADFLEGALGAGCEETPVKAAAMAETREGSGSETGAGAGSGCGAGGSIASSGSLVGGLLDAGAGVGKEDAGAVGSSFCGVCGNCSSGGKLARARVPRRRARRAASDEPPPEELEPAEPESSWETIGLPFSSRGMRTFPFFSVPNVSTNLSTAKSKKATPPPSIKYITEIALRKGVQRT
jgi:hypothetical protein